MSNTETDVVYLSGHKLFVSDDPQGGKRIEMVTDGRPLFRMKLTLASEEVREVAAQLRPQVRGINDLNLTEEENIELGQLLHDKVEVEALLIANAKAREQDSLEERIDAEIESECERLGRELTGREVTKIEKRVEQGESASEARERISAKVEHAEGVVDAAERARWPEHMTRESLNDYLRALDGLGRERIFNTEDDEGVIRVFIAVGPEGRREMSCDTHDDAVRVGLSHLRSGHWTTFTIEERWYAR